MSDADRLRAARIELVQARAELALRDKRTMRRLSMVLSIAEIKAKALHALDSGRMRVYGMTGF